MKKTYVLTLICMISLGFAGAAHAQNQQGQLDLMIPSVGAMLPLSDVVDSGDLGTNAPSGKHDFSVLFGSRLTYWFIPEMGAELELLFSPSALDGAPFSAPEDIDAQFFALNGRLVYAFGGDTRGTAFLLTGGLGIYATNYSDYEMTTGGMGVVAIGVRIPMDNALSVRIDLSNYMTTTNWELPAGSETDKILQHDLSLSVGLTINLNKK